MRRDKQRLIKELRKARLTFWHWRAAAILLSVNGIDNALEYVRGVQLKQQPLLPGLELQPKKETISRAREGST